MDTFTNPPFDFKSLLYKENFILLANFIPFLPYDEHETLSQAFPMWGLWCLWSYDKIS